MVTWLPQRQSGCQIVGLIPPLPPLPPTCPWGRLCIQLQKLLLLLLYLVNPDEPAATCQLENEWEQLVSCQAPAVAATSLITLNPRWHTILHTLCCLAWTQLNVGFIHHSSSYLCWRWLLQREEMPVRKKERNKQNLHYAVTTCPSANRPPTMADLQLR